MRFINLGLISLISLVSLGCGPGPSFGDFEKPSTLLHCPQSDDPQSDPAKGCAIPTPE